MSKDKPPKRKPRLNIAGSKFLRKYSQIIYAIILIVLIPVIIIANTLFVINKFRLNLNVQLQRQALIIGELIDATAITSVDDLPQLQDRLTRVFAGPDEIRAIDIMVPEGDGFKIIASGFEDNIGQVTSGPNNSLAWLHDDAIAHLTQPSDLDIDRVPELAGTRYWNIVMPIHDDAGNRIGLLNLKMSLKIVDQLEQQTLTGSYTLLIVTLAVVVLLTLINTRFFEYALMYRKMQEIDEMKDEFISMASHELRTPITAINGYVSMFVDGSLGELSEAGKKGMKIVEASTKRLANLIEDLLNVSRIEQGRIQLTLKPTDLNNILEQTVAELKITADAKQLQLSYEPHELPPVMADEDKLRQILINIIGNAIKYTRKGSITLSVADTDEMLKIKVKDTGIGMSAQNREKLFSKFYRVKNEQTKGITGTGLGLWITKQLITLMGGQIYVDSIEGEGTEISFTLQKDKKRK